MLKLRHREPRSTERAPSPRYFEQQLRADPRLNVTARCGWLMTALSHRSGFASMSVDRMARELNATPAAVRQARQKLVRLGLFAADGWKYRRVLLLPGEDRSGFWRRIRADSRLDLTLRAAWLLCDATRREGKAEVSLAAIGAALGTTAPASAWATRRVRELGYFTTVPGGGRGRKTIHVRSPEQLLHPVQPLQEIIIDEGDDNEIRDLDEYYSPFARRPRSGRPAAHTHAINK
jgi:hypothetical protein